MIKRGAEAVEVAALVGPLPSDLLERGFYASPELARLLVAVADATPADVERLLAALRRAA